MMTKIHRYHRMLLLVLALIATLVRASIDGGLAITQDCGATWRFVRNLPLARSLRSLGTPRHPELALARGATRRV